MDRMACVELPEFPLQLLLRRHASWRDKPVAVVDRDKPQGILLWVNEAARALRILPGTRYAVALSLASDLRAGVVADAEIRSEIESLAEKLRTFTPNVEPNASEPGVFWLAAHGIMRLFPSYEAWAARIAWLRERQALRARVAVGFSRIGTYAATRCGQDIVVFDSPSEESRRVSQVRIDRLGIDPRVRDALLRLGVETLGTFLELPADGVQTRFGEAAFVLHRKLRGDLATPVAGEHSAEPLCGVWVFDHPETQVERLVSRVEALLKPLVRRIERRDGVLSTLHVRLRFENGTHADDRLRPATPTLDLSQVLRLVQLRLEARTLDSAVEELEVEVLAATARHEQLTLFACETRDLRAANRALARLRAELGDGAVRCALLRDGHLPEGRYTWEPLHELRAAQPDAVIVPPLVRRVHARPVPLPLRPRHEPDGWLVAGFAAGPVEDVVGPHVISGGWWMRSVERAYYFLRTRSGRWLWVYEDRLRNGWFLHGEVE